MLDTAIPTITHETLRHLVRVGRTPVLEVTVSYPCLTHPVDAAAPACGFPLSRFNEGYRAMAEAFLAWAVDTLAVEATESFAALGTRAAYVFDRRLATCRMEASLESPDADGKIVSDVLTVRRCCELSSRRGTIPTGRAESVEHWRWGEWTLLSSRRQLFS